MKTSTSPFTPTNIYIFLSSLLLYFAFLWVLSDPGFKPSTFSLLATLINLIFICSKYFHEYSSYRILIALFSLEVLFTRLLLSDWTPIAQKIEQYPLLIDRAIMLCAIIIFIMEFTYFFWEKRRIAQANESTKDEENSLHKQIDTLKEEQKQIDAELALKRNIEKELSEVQRKNIEGDAKIAGLAKENTSQKEHVQTLENQLDDEIGKTQKAEHQLLEIHSMNVEIETKIDRLIKDHTSQKQHIQMLEERALKAATNLKKQVKAVETEKATNVIMARQITDLENEKAERLDEAAQQTKSKNDLIERILRLNEFEWGILAYMVLTDKKTWQAKKIENFSGLIVGNFCKTTTDSFGFNTGFHLRFWVGPEVKKYLESAPDRDEHINFIRNFEAMRRGKKGLKFSPPKRYDKKQ